MKQRQEILTYQKQLGDSLMDTCSVVWPCYEFEHSKNSNFGAKRNCLLSDTCAALVTNGNIYTFIH